MGDYQINRYVQNTETLPPKERFGDLMFKEVVFVYAMTLGKDALGGQTESYTTVPVPISASVQVSATNGQQTDPAKAPNREAHIYTRQRNGIRWHDRLIWNGITMVAEYVEEKKSNSTGEFQYLRCRAVFVTERDSIAGQPAVVKGA